MEINRSKGDRGYPERFLIYHAGTSNLVFLGCLKITTIFVFSVQYLFLIPAWFQAPDQPYWALAASQS